jgi:hypothetical protein
MKTFYIILAALFCFLLFFNGCIVAIVGDVTAPAPANTSTLQLISLAILGIYEVVVRAVPSVGNYSVVSWLITALKFVSDKLNNSR